MQLSHAYFVLVLHLVHEPPLVSVLLWNHLEREHGDEPCFKARDKIINVILRTNVVQHYVHEPSREPRLKGVWGVHEHEKANCKVFLFFQQIDRLQNVQEDHTLTLRSL